MIGQRISHYRIQKRLGKGSMGEVFLAHDTNLDRKVALKFLSEELQQDEIARIRFIREAKSVASIDHPYICNIHQIGESGGRVFLALEYVAGPTLSARLVDGPLPIGEALEAAKEIAEALEEA